MNPSTPNGWRDYIFAASVVAAAVCLRILLQPALGHEYEFTTLFLAVVLSAWKGGFRLGMFALTLDCIVAGAIHGFRNESVLPANADDAMGLLLYIIMAVSVSLLGETQRKSVYDLTVESLRKERLIDQLAMEVALREKVQNELRESQVELLHLNASLEERVVERTNELTMAIQELESFTYSMAHDMRAPLRAVNTTCRLMADEHSGKSDPAGRALLDSAIRAAEFMNEFVDDLLEFARLARAPIHKRKIDLTPILKAASEEIVATERYSIVKIQPAMEVTSDPYLAAALFRELIDNAVKFRRPGLPCEVEIYMEEVEDADIITVSDGGIGFEPRYAARIFEPFQKLHGTGLYPGTGIGLAKAKRIIERLGGRIWAESEPAGGTKIRILMPHRYQHNFRPVESDSLRMIADLSV